MIFPAAALDAGYVITPDGREYNADIELANADHFFFFSKGLLGERVPFEAGNITLIGQGEEVPFETTSGSQITFPKGNYTLSFTGLVTDNTIQAEFDQPYNVSVRLPEIFDIRNPLLGMISPGGMVEEEDSTLVIRWEQARFIECRFYDNVREQALIIFGTFWITLCAIFILPYLIMRSIR